MKTKDLTVIDFHYCANTDAFLVLARRADNDSHLKKQLVGWMPRLNPDTLIEPHAFLDPGSAKKHFDEAAGDEDRPTALLDAKDFQKHTVYRWEDDFVLSETDPDLSGPDEAKSIMRRVARDYHIPCPKLNWIEEGHRSEYDDDDNEIDFSHRNLKSLLHEMAHAIHNYREGDNRGQDHGPAFVWIAIELYSRYAGMSLPYLIHSAGNAGILGYMGGPLPSPDAGQKSGPVADTRHSPQSLHP